MHRARGGDADGVHRPAGDPAGVGADCFLARLPPLRWTHPRQIALDARARRRRGGTPRRRRRSSPRLSWTGRRCGNGTIGWTVSEKRRRRILRATCYDVLLRGIPRREARRSRRKRSRRRRPNDRRVSDHPHRPNRRPGIRAFATRGRTISVADDGVIRRPVTEAFDFSSLSPPKLFARRRGCSEVARSSSSSNNNNNNNNRRNV